MLWEWRGIANMDFIQLGGSSRVGEMILARERSGFAGEKVWGDIPVVVHQNLTTYRNTKRACAFHIYTDSLIRYAPTNNPNDQQNDSETPINFDSDKEDDEPTPQPKPKTPKPVKETPTPKPYKPKISYPQRLRKEKMEAQYGKFLDMIRAVRVNVPLVDVLAGMPNYGKFLKELGTDNQEKDEKQSQNDKTGLGMEKL
ncbi:hypothetical protein Tco_0909761 [Tanacetum coccineum]|uniref:Reverse transcriptase domain-containing protein n=1 Tax=Tanacetum coccineum TaxID=301880 RepID=A0ABQ5CQY4_9ASTR